MYAAAQLDGSNGRSDNNGSRGQTGGVPHTDRDRPRRPHWGLLAIEVRDGYADKSAAPARRAS
jgi:hypothetical protein